MLPTDDSQAFSNSPAYMSEHSVAPAEFGERLQVFKGSAANVFAGFLLGLMLVGAGVGLCIWMFFLAKGNDWDMPIFAESNSWSLVVCVLLMGLALFAFGVMLCRGVYRNGNPRLELHANGFRRISRRGAEDVLWSDVAVIEELISNEKLPVVKGPAKMLVPTVQSTSFSVKTRKGDDYRFSRGNILEFPTLTEMLREIAREKNLPWETKEFRL